MSGAGKAIGILLPGRTATPGARQRAAWMHASFAAAAHPGNSDARIVIWEPFLDHLKAPGQSNGYPVPRGNAPETLKIALNALTPGEHRYTLTGELSCVSLASPSYFSVPVF
jgi:hypothetical protein